MTYQICVTHSATGVLKKLDRPLRERLREALERLAANPFELGEQLRQPLSTLHSHHVRYKGLEWRVGYHINVETETVYVVLIGPHENFYRTLKRKLDACLAFR
jgi:mRNA interferase RelE/StbE